MQFSSCHFDSIFSESRTSLKTMIPEHFRESQSFGIPSRFPGKIPFQSRLDFFEIQYTTATVPYQPRDSGIFGIPYTSNNNNYSLYPFVCYNSGLLHIK